MIKVWKLLSVSIVLAVCLGLMLVPMVSSAAPPAGTAGFLAHVPGQPGNSTITISPGGTFDMNVTLDNSHNLTLYGAVAAMDFDASLLSVTGITNGTNWPTYLTAAWDNINGWVASEAGVAYPIVPLTTNTTQCVVHFQSTGVAGSTMVNFTTGVNETYDTKVANDTGIDVLDWSSLQNFSVTIIGIPQLTVNVTPAGKGTVKANGVNLTGYPNTTNWTTGDNVTLLAVNSTCGWGFLNWTGDLSGSTNPKNITMDALTKNVTANFVELPPALNVTPPSLTLTVAPDATGTTNYTVTNLGGHTLSWNSSNVTYVPAGNMTWLTQNITSGNLNACVSHTVLVTANATGLELGTYNATINITGNSSVPLLVTLTVGVPGLPKIAFSPASFTFFAAQGEQPPDQTLEIWNSGTGTLDWSVSEGVAWLSESSTRGSSTGEHDSVTVSVRSLVQGDYHANITISAPGADNTPQSVPVTLRVVTKPVAPAQLSASGLSISPQQVKPGQQVTISINVANSGGETGSYNAVLYINSAVEDSQSVSVAPGMTKNVIFTVSKSDAGVYDVSIAGQSGQFTVVGGGWFGGGLGTGGIVAIVVIVIVLIVAVVFVLRGTRRAI